MTEPTTTTPPKRYAHKLVLSELGADEKPEFADDGPDTIYKNLFETVAKLPKDQARKLGVPSETTVDKLISTVKAQIKKLGMKDKLEAKKARVENYIYLVSKGYTPPAPQT